MRSSLHLSLNLSGTTSQQGQPTNNNNALPSGCPPIDPGGPADAVSFTALDMALRSHPELARESSSTLNPTALAKLVEGIRRFVREHLGKDAKGARWPLVNIPDSIWRDRSRTGPLFVALVAAYRHRQACKWRNFDMDVTKRHDDHIAMLKRIEKDLIEAGHLVRPRIFFDETVPRDQLSGLESIVTRFSGVVVETPAEATHVVAHDEEVDTPETLDDNKEPERMYLRTLSVFQPKQPAGYPQMALVHWWFWPSSSDEWMPAANVDGEVEDPPDKPPGVWCVACRFIRDVAKFNEWGNEIDYAILDYQKKVACYSKKNSAVLRKKAPVPENIPKNHVYGQLSFIPKSITTGTRSQKRTVFDGPLTVMTDVVERLNRVYQSKSIDNSKPPDLSLAPAIVRPLEDVTLGENLKVINLSVGVDSQSADKDELDVEDEEAEQIYVNTTRCLYQMMPTTTTKLPQRIRGGGETSSEGNSTGMAANGASDTTAHSGPNAALNADTKQMTPSSSTKSNISTDNAKGDNSSGTKSNNTVRTKRPEWFLPSQPSDFEKVVLPEWFDNSAPHRSEVSYIQTRNEMLRKANENNDFYLTATVVRRTIAGDVGSLLRLHKFLTQWGLINGKAIGESTPSSTLPTLISMREKVVVDCEDSDVTMEWSEEEKLILVKTVVGHAAKRRKLDGASDDIDWSEVARDVGKPAESCCKVFLETDLLTKVENVQNESSNKEAWIHELLSGVHPDVLTAAFNGAMNVTSNVDEAKKASLLAVLARDAVRGICKEETQINDMMHEILDQRMKKIENRISTLDDVEQMLEAQRVALEMERRDLYAMRCRYWLGE